MKKLARGSHQGDVSITYVGDIGMKLNKEMLTPVSLDKFNQLTVVMGEALDHAHCFEDPNVVELYEYPTKLSGLRRFVAEVKEDTALKHYDVTKKELTKDHRPIPLPKGIYRFGTQRQTDPDNEKFYVPSPD